MPWTSADAQKHDRKADTQRKQQVWAQVSTNVLGKTGDEGRAIREANAVIGRIKNGTPDKARELKRMQR